MLRKIRYAIEALILLPMLVILRLLPLDAASGLGAMIGRAIGPHLRVHRTAQNNMRRAMPEMPEALVQKTLLEMWDNLGRVVGEYPHLSRPIMAKRITIEGREHLERIKTSGKGAIFFSGHISNWEIVPLTTALCGLPLMLIYRAANNPVSDWVIRMIRSNYNSSMANKGRRGAQEALKTLKEGNCVGMLVDQKMNDGSAIPFFGHDAMTATAIASICSKQQVPYIGIRTVRTDGAHFHVTIYPAVQPAKDADSIEVLKEINVLFEEWIRQHPAQWFWVHNRWNFPS